MDRYFWTIVAAVCGGFVAQVRRAEELPLWKRASHLVAGAACAVYLSPGLIVYFKLVDSEWQYLVPFAVGAFWWKLFEQADASISSIKLPWSKQ